jgi:Endonuclease/Exonuclease/phosphatase family
MIIWLATWNCENQAPNATMLGQFIVPDFLALPHTHSPVPEIIVVALQEARPQNDQFVSERLAPALGVYTHVAEHYMNGMTKGKVNYIHMGVLAHNAHVNYVQNITTGKYKDGLEGKGGVYINLTYNNLASPPAKQFCFIGAHLDSKDATKRDRQIRELLRKVTNSNANATDTAIAQALTANFHAVFFMGDLNYRLTSGGGIPVGTQVQTMVNLISTPAGRTQLWRQDTLNGEALSVAVDLRSILVSKFGFDFPRMDHLLPTYKREYQNQTPCQALGGLVTAGNAGNLAPPPTNKLLISDN